MLFGEADLSEAYRIWKLDGPELTSLQLRSRRTGRSVLPGRLETAGSRPKAHSGQRAVERALARLH